MAQLLLQGTNFVNFMGRYIYIGEGKHGIEAAVVTERDEPQAVIGSYLHKLAYPGTTPSPFEKDGRQLHEPIITTAKTCNPFNCAANISTPPKASTASRSTT